MQFCHLANLCIFHVQPKSVTGSFFTLGRPLGSNISTGKFWVFGRTVFGGIWVYLVGIMCHFLSVSFNNGCPSFVLEILMNVDFSTVPKNGRHHLGFERASPQFSFLTIFPNQGFSIL